MKLKLAYLLCLLLLTHAFARRALRQDNNVACILNRPDTAVAIVDVDVRLEGPGRVSAHASATAQAASEAADAIADIVADAVSDVAEGGDAVAIADTATTLVAEAVATAYAGVAIDISSTAENAQVCARSFSQASSTASAFAQLFLNVLAEASNAISFSSVGGAVDAITAASSSAFADADALVCGEGVFDADVVANTLAEAVAKIYIDVFAIALAAVSGGTATSDIIIEVEADVITTSFADGQTAADVEGNVIGGARTDGSSCSVAQNQCTTRFLGCCNAQRTNCRCGVSCRAEPAELGEGSLFGYTITEGRAGSFRQGDVCFCPI